MKQVLVTGLLKLLAASTLFASSHSTNANTLHAAILPNEIGHLEFNADRRIDYEFFATIINDTDDFAENCRIELRDELPFALRFWTTEPVLNRFTGEQDSPADIAPRSSQSFRFSLELGADVHLIEQRVGFEFVCDTHQSAPQVNGINDVLLSVGAPEASKILAVMVTPDADNRVVLSTQLGDEKCSGVLRYPEGPAPCAAGVMALAMLNNSAQPVQLSLQVDSDGPGALLCRTDASGACQEAAAPYRDLEFELEADEIATFSAFLLTFQDEYFGYVQRPRMTGFSVFEFSPAANARGRLVAQTSTELISPAFGWSAVLADGQLAVRGSVAVFSSCGSGILEPLVGESTPAGELHLQLRLDEGMPFQLCLQAIVLDRVSWDSAGPVEGIESVVITYMTENQFLETEPLVLPVTRAQTVTP